MIARAVEASRAAAPAGADAPVVLAVTILTSHDDEALRRIGIDGTCAGAVPRLAALAREAGAGGVVCSPLEVASARRAFPEGRARRPGHPPGHAGIALPDDQSRVASAAAAVAAGADRIVVGRPDHRRRRPRCRRGGDRRRPPPQRRALGVTRERDASSEPARRPACRSPRAPAPSAARRTRAMRDSDRRCFCAGTTSTCSSTRRPICASRPSATV